MSLCDRASTIVQKLFGVLEIHAVLLGADSLQGLKMGASAVSYTHLTLPTNREV